MKSFSPKCQGGVGETMPNSVGEYRPHASSGVSGARVLVPVFGVPPSDGENRGLSWSLKSNQEVTKDKRGPTLGYKIQ